MLSKGTRGKTKFVIIQFIEITIFACDNFKIIDDWRDGFDFVTESMTNFFIFDHFPFRA